MRIPMTQIVLYIAQLAKENAYIGEWQKLLLATEPIIAKMMKKKKTLNPVHPFLTKIVPGPGLILLMIQQMILLVNLSFEVCISILNKKCFLRIKKLDIL